MGSSKFDTFKCTETTRSCAPNLLPPIEATQDFLLSLAPVLGPVRGSWTQQQVRPSVSDLSLSAQHHQEGRSLSLGASAVSWIGEGGILKAVSGISRAQSVDRYPLLTVLKGREWAWMPGTQELVETKT
ncbi:hypothetical protein EJB05_31778, partial [Eragrostis curvula]